MNPSGEGHLKLSAEDQRLLDELMEQGLDPECSAPSAPADRARADRIMSLLGLLDDYPVDEADATLVHATMAHIDRVEDHRGARMTLAPQDRASLQSRRFRVPMPNFIGVAAGGRAVASMRANDSRISLTSACSSLGMSSSSYFCLSRSAK